MPSNRPVEHFVTLFDSNFLPMGMCLHASLMQHGQPFRLWILCMDELVEQQLRKLVLPHVSLIPLQEVETDALLDVKNGRTRGEYCWTLTPFTPQAVFDRDPSVQRVTYLDADMFFFDSPQILLEEFAASGKHVLITEHAYAPEYDQSETSGRFCVQFMTFRRTQEGAHVMRWWQDRCIEWCFSRFEDGKFGDQKYLNDWPVRFAGEVHVLQQVEKTLAPWNVKHLETVSGALAPVFYHFHALRIVNKNLVMLYLRYQIGKAGLVLYEEYMRTLRRCLGEITSHKLEIKCRPLEKGKWGALRELQWRFMGTVAYTKIE